MTVEQYNQYVDDFTPGVYRFILRMTKNNDVARDIVQEAFVRLWENQRKVAEGKEKAYLFTIAHRVAIDHFRRKKKVAGLSESYPVIDGYTARDHAYNNISEIVNGLLEKLPSVQRNVLMLRDYEGYSYKEISEITSLTESQVKVYIFRARVFIKERIGDISTLI